MNDNKICPDCNCEFLPHIMKCSDCGTTLLLPEEYQKALEEKKRIAEEIVKNTVVVREGDMDWMRELRTVLVDAGVPCAVHSNAGCNKGCCGGECRLVVSRDDLERARGIIEEYYMEVSPELRASHELLKEGKCPACGSPVGQNDPECRDCGLPLLIIEEE